MMKLLILFLLILNPLCLGVSSLDFDQANDEVRKADVSGIDTATMSVSMWIKHDDLTSLQNLLSTATALDTTSTGCMFTRVQVNTNSNFAYFHNTTNGSWNTDTNAFPTTWQNYVVTYDRTLNANNPVQYLNGLNATSTQVGIPSTTPVSGCDNFIFGEDPNNAADYDGRAAFVTFYAGKILTQVEVIEVMYKPDSVPDSKKLLWALWGDATDLSGNGNTGTVAGATNSADGPPVFVGGVIM